MPTGRIKRMVTSRGFGFIETSSGKDLFFHCSKLHDTEFASLQENQLVEFEVTQFTQGLQAVNVRLADFGQDMEENGRGAYVNVPTGWDEESSNQYSDPEELSPLTNREELFIQLAVSITRGTESSTRNQLDIAREMGIDRNTLAIAVDHVVKANADSCRAVSGDIFAPKSETPSGI